MTDKYNELIALANSIRPATETINNIARNLGSTCDRFPRILTMDAPEPMIIKEAEMMQSRVDTIVNAAQEIVKNFAQTLSPAELVLVGQAQLIDALKKIPAESQMSVLKAVVDEVTKQIGSPVKL